MLGMYISCCLRQFRSHGVNFQWNMGFRNASLTKKNTKKHFNNKVYSYFCLLTTSCTNKNDVMRLGERPRSLEGKPNYLDLPFAIKLYYSMSTISYTPWFSYQINMTLIECSRIRKTRPFAWRSDSEPP